MLENGTGRGLQAIIVYLMNALANSQREELDKFVKLGFSESNQPVSYARYTGQETAEQRERILKNPPDIILTNYVMLELILTRVGERALVKSAGDLRFLVFDELHTYRGRQGADVSMLIRRCRNAFGSSAMRCVGTSATMASEGTSEDQVKVVADVASKIFGEHVPESNVIGESLTRTTNEYDFAGADKQQLISEISDSDPNLYEFDDFVSSPLAAWMETRFGLRSEEETGKLVRQPPLQITGAASQLAELTSVAPDAAATKIREFLLAGSRCKRPNSAYPFFAFRLHQFITRGDTAWATLESESERDIFLKGQQFVPGDRSRILLPMVFCRSCGQPYYRVNVPKEMEDGKPITPREDFKKIVHESLESGYLYLSTTDPWPDDVDEQVRRVPPDWLEEHRGQPRIKRNQKVPQNLCVSKLGTIDPNGISVAFVPAPFRFCLNPKCKIAYNARQRSDASKLSTIGIDGRSTATTILALSTILKLRLETDLPQKARKLLSFTDNRQDASLQAGHYNDFVEMCLLRSALYRAMSRIPDGGLSYDELVGHVEKSMDLAMHLYSKDELRGPALEETKRALRSVIRYFLYRDQERDWRVTSPNLEQCGLLKIDYLGIDECVEDEEFWSTSKDAPGLMRVADPPLRKRVILALLDHLRRSLAIKEDALSGTYQERICEQSKQRLREPWVIEDVRDMVQGGIAWPRSRAQGDRGYNDVYISPQSNFGQFISRILAERGETASLVERGELIIALFKSLKTWGFVEEVRDPIKGSQVNGYQIPSSTFIWRTGDETAPIDELRVTQQSEQQNSGNEYFIELYKNFAANGGGLEAREHTAQVLADVREEREKRFREADLPLMFCSPTMELGLSLIHI